MSGTTWRANARLLTGAAGRYAHLNRLRLTSLAAVLAVVAMSLVSGATAAQAAISTPFSAVFSQNTTGDILLRGNTVMTCPTAAANCTAARNTVGGTAPSNGNLNDNNYWMTFVDVDSDATTFNSSASTVDMPANASVLYAALVWGGRTAAGSTIGATPGTAPPTAADKNKVKLQVPGSSTYTDITASWTQTNATNYQGFADVTTLVAGAGNGSYTVANVQTGQGGDSHGGWALAIAYRDVDAPARNLTIFRGFGSVASGESFDIPVSGFSTPPAGAVRTTLGAVSWDGDLGSSGDQLLLGNTTGTLTNISDSQHAATNVFNSMITEKGVDSSTRNPKYTNQLGFDAATFNVDGKLPNSATSAVIRVTSASETYWPGIITFAHDLYAPNIDMTKSVSVVKAPGNIIPGLVEPGDELEYTLDGVNNGYDDATATVLTDTMPAGTTYVPASMTWNGVPKTDATGDDEAKYTSGTRTITVNLGVSASPTAGGNVAIGASTQTVTFRVTVDAVTDQQSIANTASVSYSGVLFTSSVSGASSTASSVAVQHRSNLALVKTRDLSQVVVGSSTPVTYTLTVTNNGPYGDPGVSLTDNLPGGAVLGTVTPSQGSCTTPVGQVTCNLGALANGATATVTVRAVLDGSADPATNSASVTGTNFDPSVANNTSSVSTVVDRAPVAVNDARTTTAGAVTFDPRSNDSDPDGDTLTVTAPTTTTPSRGSVVVNGNNTITYTATAGQAGTDTFTYQVSDGRGGTATATVTVTIPNTAPIAANDSSTGTPGAPVTVSVLANDSDANIPTIGSQSLSVSSVTQPAGGTGVVTTNGSTVTFTPAGTFTKGTTTFTYTIADGAGGSSTADVTITVPDDAPVAADDATATPSQTAVDVDVLANDSDDNGDALTLTGVTGAAHGTATVVGSGAAARVHYVPAAGWFGADTMTYTVTDGTTPVTAQLTVTTGSAAPVAAGFSRTVSGGTPTAIDVLSHVTDSDTAAASLSTIGTAGAAHGSVSVNSSGAVVYTPNATYAGPDSFTYTVQDPEGNIATATVTLTVSNQGPAASDDTAIVPLNGSVDVNVLLNDSDGNNDPLVVSVTSGTTPHGTVTVLPSKQIRYTPTPGYLGTDSFTYTVDDGNGGTDTATVDVSVANDPPVTVSDTVVHNGPVGSALNVFVLANDSDPNGDALALDSITIVPAHGTATIVGGHVVYTPDPSYAGPDTFSYRVSDGHSAFSDGVVNVDVRNAAPIAADDTATASSAIAKTIDVLGNDSDPDTEALTLTSVSSPAHGVATVVAGKVRYLPATGFQGTDTFIYVVTDPRGATATATVTVTIGNAPPVTGPGTASTPGGTPRTIDLMQLVSDPDGQPVSITSVSSASHGTVTLDPATGKVVYNPAKGYMGPDSFCYTAADGNGAMSTACVTVHVGNTPPVANDDAAVTQYDQPIKVNVAANDSDPNGQDLTVTKVKLVKGKGTVTVTSDGLVKVTPKAGYTGVIEIDYTITDGDGGTTDATVRVRVTKPGVVPPAAESLDDTATIAVGKKAVTLDPTSIVKHHGKLAVTSITKPTDGVTVKLVDNKLVVTKKGTYVGKATFTYVVMGRDGVPVTVHQTVNVLGTSFPQSPTSPAEPQARALPHTGASNVMPIGLAGLALVGLGSLALLASVRRSTGSAE
jgi:uncharacterized repeat protein (TIGR01451 family)/LPXTG-motif cell wall-anchored protein